ncbi:AMP-binding protein [Flexivirga alba]|uniref:AMP-binding protein n=1 Tax=Flexivirga alba TaxID=702742 RepID=A0ABW2AB41_9MICO
MPDLQPFAVEADDLTDYRTALAAALDGSGPAIAPYADGVAPVFDPAAPLPEGLALVVGTSGSTGTPKRAMLTRDALIASADATHDRLGGPGQWLLSMPAQHIAGTQVLIRSVRAGTVPLALPTSTLPNSSRPQANSPMTATTPPWSQRNCAACWTPGLKHAQPSRASTGFCWAARQQILACSPKRPTPVSPC